MPIQIYTIPIQGKYILYRPLAQLAFIGNRAMADLVSDLASHPSSPNTNAPEEAMTFLKAIGFLDPDPPPPPPPDPSYSPTSTVLLLTSRCNLRCTYCYANAGEGPVQDLALELARVAIDRACQNATDLGLPSFGLGFHGGGEPVQAWETVQWATAYARSKDLACYISMVSNGVWRTGQRDWILHNLDSVNISFDGRRETQDRQRPFASGQGSFRVVMRTISVLEKAGFPYTIRMTATPPWRGQLPEDVRFICEETGCPAIQVEPTFSPQRGGHRGPTQEQGEAFAEAFMEAFEIAHRSGRQLMYSGARPWLVAQAFCTAPYSAFVVTPTGDLVACYEVTNDRHPLARMFTIGRIVDSRIVVDDRARTALLTHLEERRARCRDCFCYWHCAGDCYLRAHAATVGRLDNTNPRCTMNKEISARILLWYIMDGDGVWQGQEVHPQEEQLVQNF